MPNIMVVFILRERAIFQGWKFTHLQEHSGLHSHLKVFSNAATVRGESLHNKTKSGQKQPKSQLWPLTIVLDIDRKLIEHSLHHRHRDQIRTLLWQEDKRLAWVRLPSLISRK